MEKRCNDCLKVKPIANFHKDRLQSDGLDSSCKPCAREAARGRSKAWYERNAEKKRAYAKAYYQTHKEERKAYQKKHSQHIVAGRNAIRAALDKGELTKEPCDVCGNEKVQAHHYNGYSDKHLLDVVWLCSKHHGDAHHAMNTSL